MEPEIISVINDHPDKFIRQIKIVVCTVTIDQFKKKREHFAFQAMLMMNNRFIARETGSEQTVRVF